MPTEKLYETRGTLFETRSIIKSCVKANDGYEILTDKTPFFPGGGGQEADEGKIGDAEVVRLFERGGDVIHVTNMPLEEGTYALFAVNAEKRFSRMQNHGGEHILSGLINEKCGFNNVGFHMGEDAVTVDFDGVLNREQLGEIEILANRAVAGNKKINIMFPSGDELNHLKFRSKKKLSGRVRIVEIEGLDRCACCAPHLDLTGQIGIIKILDFMHYKGGVRIQMLCGFDALRDYNERLRSDREISALLSAPQNSLPSAVSALKEENGRLRGALNEAKRKMLDEFADGISDTDGNLCVFRQTDADGLRRLASALSLKCKGICGVFTENRGDGYTFAIASSNVNLRECAGYINRCLSAKGGGSAELMQGHSEADKKTVEEFFRGFDGSKKN